MPQPTHSSGLSFTRELPGILVFLAVILGTQQLAFHFEEPFLERLDLLADRPGEDPPWYFITRDFASGIFASGAYFLSLLAAVATWRRWPTYSSMMVWSPLISHGSDIARAWIIYHACPGLMDGQRTTSRWPTFDSYFFDPDISRAQTLVPFGGLFLAIGLAWAERRFRRKPTRATGPAEALGEQNAPSNGR